MNYKYNIKMQQKIVYAHLPLNQHKINTTRKILKLKKIKKRKIRCPGAPQPICNYSIKKMEDKIKKNETKLDNNSFQNINNSKNQLLEDNNIINNLSDNIITNITDNNISNQSNNITSIDDNTTIRNNSLSLPIMVAIPPYNFNFEFLYGNNYFPNFSFYNSLEFENHNNNLLGATFFGGDNGDEFLVENPTNNRSNIIFHNINSSDRNEINPQNNNTSINNQNNSQINLRSNDFEFYFDYPRQRNRTNQSNNQINLRSNDSEFHFDYPRQRNRTNQSNNQINLRSNDSEFYFDYPRQRNRTNQSNNQINLRSNDSEFHFDNPRQRNRANRTNSDIIRNIKNKLTKIRFKKSESSNENREFCIICYEDFKKYQNIYSLPCSHRFHVHCLNREIKFRQKCPICRNVL